MKNKLFCIFIFIFLFAFFIYSPKTYAVTEKQKAVGQAIVNLAKDVSNNNKTDFAYSFYFGLDSEGNPKKMESVMSQRQKANWAGIKYSGYIYGSTPSSAGIQGSRENKFFVYCDTYAKFIVYYATSKDGTLPALESGDTDYDSLVPGDIVSIHQETESITYGHTFLYLDDAGDDDPYTMTIAQSPGTGKDSEGNRAAVEITNANFKGMATSSDTIKFGITSVKRLTPEAAEAVSYNLLNASTNLYDRLDNDKPSVDNVSHNSKGEIIIKATDTKIEKYESFNFPTGIIRTPVSEPANSGIVAYQITESAVEPITNWIDVSTTNSLELTTAPVKSNGTYYVWVLDVGGNTNYKEVVVSDVNFDTTPPTLGTPNIKEYDDRIEIEITGATDSSGIQEYTFYLNGNEIVTQAQNAYVYENLEESTNYTLKYTVVDTNGNSAISQDISATTLETKITEVYPITGSYISRIKDNMKLQEFMKNINDNVQGSVFTKDGQQLKSTDFVGTGMELRTAKKGTYIIIVTGDVTGDGEITVTDLLRLKRRLVHLEVFDEISNIAVDVDYSNQVSITDLLKMKQALVGLIDL